MTYYDLNCPNCNGAYIHHYKIEIFSRKEDAKTGLHICTEYDQISIDQNLIDNPSPRRHGLKIYFNCEECKVQSRLALFQNKRNTMFSFESIKNSSTNS